jgi:hypothetical protein
MKWPAQRSSLTAPAVIGRLRPAKGELVRWGLFALVEGLAELLRHHLQHAWGGVFSSGLVAALACSCWAYGAHERFAFRGVASTFQPRLFGLAPFLAASLAVINLQKTLGLIHAPAGAWSLSIWTLVEIAKYLIVRTVIWPSRHATSTAAA